MKNTKIVELLLTKEQFMTIHNLIKASSFNRITKKLSKIPRNADILKAIEDSKHAVVTDLYSSRINTKKDVIVKEMEIIELKLAFIRLDKAEEKDKYKIPLSEVLASVLYKLVLLEIGRIEREPDDNAYNSLNKLNTIHTVLESFYKRGVLFTNKKIVDTVKGNVNGAMLLLGGGRDNG